MRQNVRALSAIVAALGWLVAGVGHLQAQEGAHEPFPKQLLEDGKYAAQGKEVFNKICKFCHGKAAYPGKAPKLNPARYTAEFVFDRVTNGFRGMPAFKEQFSEQERQAVTVYVMGKGFSN